MSPQSFARHQDARAARLTRAGVGGRVRLPGIGRHARATGGAGATTVILVSCAAAVRGLGDGIDLDVDGPHAGREEGDRQGEDDRAEHGQNQGHQRKRRVKLLFVAADESDDAHDDRGRRQRQDDEKGA